MKYLKKTLKLIGFILLVTLASIGLGLNAAIMPSFKRQDSNEPKIEMIDSRHEESENQEKP